MKMKKVNLIEVLALLVLSLILMLIMGLTDFMNGSYVPEQSSSLITEQQPPQSLSENELQAMSQGPAVPPTDSELKKMSQGPAAPPTDAELNAMSQQPQTDEEPSN